MSVHGRSDITADLLADVYAQGWADGAAHADAAEWRALVVALADGDAPTWRAAVDRHERIVRRVQRRHRADGGDPQQLAEYGHDATRHVAELRAHDTRCLREAGIRHTPHRSTPHGEAA